MSSSSDSNSGRGRGEPHANGAIEANDVLGRLNHGASWARANGRAKLGSLLDALSKELRSLDASEDIEELRAELNSQGDELIQTQKGLADLELEVLHLRSELAHLIHESESREPPVSTKRRKKRTP